MQKKNYVTFLWSCNTFVLFNRVEFIPLDAAQQLLLRQNLVSERAVPEQGA